MQKFLQFIKSIKFPRKSRLQKGFNALTHKELSILVISIIVAFVSLLSILGNLNKQVSIELPEYGGSITEGIIGTPTLVNPVLAISDADKDITALVYSGLMRKTPTGDIVPDLAQSIDISPDGTQYTFILKDGLKFHNGMPLTVDDVIFTISKVHDPLIKSPRKTQWEGVEVTKKDDKTVVFTLKQPYASFIDNTTIGILPEALWSPLPPAEFGLSAMNVKAIGSGPYVIDSVSRDNENVPTDYQLSLFKNFILGKPYIKNITIVSYANEKELVNALKKGYIDQAGGISPAYAHELSKDDFNINTSVLPRVFGIFFNTNENKLLSDLAVRKAISVALDRESIIESVLYGYGTPMQSPVPKGMENEIGISSGTKEDGDIAKAQSILESAGWKKGEDGIYGKGGGTRTVTTGTGKKKKTTVVSNGPASKLSFSITTGDTPELKDTAEKIKETMLTLGINVDIKVYETGQLNQIIRSRKYEALLFGQVINHESDLFAFWHTSQRTDPGINIAMYSNKGADSILETVPKVLKRDDRIKKYAQFATLWSQDLPAIMIYSPYYIYVMSQDIHVANESTITVPSERFSSIYSWYTNVNLVWKIFQKSN